MTRRALWLALLALAPLLAAPASLPAQEEDAGVRETGEGVLVDFRDTDIRLVLSALAEAGGLNVTFSNLPARQVTLRLTRPVPRAEILPLLRSLAQSNGLRLIEEEGGFLRVEALGTAGPAAAMPEAAPGETRLFVYRVRHVQAERLASTLQALYGGGGGERRAAGGATRTLSERLRRQAVPAIPDAEGDVDVAVAPPVVDAPREAGLPADVTGEVLIVADETTNSILVRAEPADWEAIRQAIDALDLRPMQVLIEVLIAEVRRSRELNVGVSARGSRSRAEGVFGVFPDSLGASPGEFVLRVMNLGDVDLDVAVSALAAGGRARILSRPVLLAQNNRESKILVGSERPFVQVVRALPTGTSARDQVVQYRDVGTSLTIKPTINPDGYVNIDLVQEVSTVTGEVQFDAPVISNREAATQLFVRDGQTVVIGGLIDWQQEHNRSGIPILRDIPILGYLFGATRRNTINSELFLFLTPHIIRTDEDADRVRRSVEARSGVAPDEGVVGSWLVPADSLPLPPETPEAEETP